jgi:hypothetical protein
MVRFTRRDQTPRTWMHHYRIGQLTQHSPLMLPVFSILHNDRAGHVGHDLCWQVPLVCRFDVENNLCAQWCVIDAFNGISGTVMF